MKSCSKPALSAALNELKAFPIFQNYSIERLCDLCTGAEILICKHREVVFKFADDANRFGVVLSGAFKLSRPTVVGEDAVIHFSSPGDVVGALIMAQPNPKYPVTLTAMGPSRYLSIPKNNFVQHWSNDSELIMNIQALLSTRMNNFHAQKAMLKSPAAARIAELLIKLADQSNPDELLIKIPLTRKEIADNLGLTVESVIRIMSDWSKQEYIKTSDQIITILKPEKLLSFIS